ncbi:MAG: BREX system ATP-binding domain-containing protein [Leptolyngbyaceae bacterium]|nr:BREX system ATP-binding domain-containing protein [Leptolyngbyaceae bacterium]
MQIEDLDIDDLLSGQPPSNSELLVRMTLGRDRWLNRIRDHYLANYIADGGSKVKVLVGGPGTGKTHLLEGVLLDAQALGYETVYLSAQEYRLNDLPSLYRAIVKQLNTEQLVQGLCCHVAKKLGYGQYDGTDNLLPLLYEDRGLTRDLAIREVKEAAGLALKDVDFGPSFKAFAYTVINSRLIYGNEETVRLALKWLGGERLERHQKQSTNLFERLQKVNARYWLNSLIRLLKLAGITGLVVAIDDLEVMAGRNSETRRFFYTPNAIKDTCELFRQMIDDGELLDHFLLLLAGRQEMVEDDKRGFKSYEALWMRLQTGIIPTDKFNPLADIVDTDSHLVAHGKDFPDQIQAKLRQLLREAGLEVHDRELPDLSEYSHLRARIIEVAMMVLEAG